MPDNDQNNDGTASPEAFRRLKDQNAALQKERDALMEQLGEATRVLTNYNQRDAARAYFKGKVADPDAVADLAAPHLVGVDSDKIAELLEQDKFKPLLASSPIGPPSAGEPDTISSSSEPAGFGGPSPGGDNGAQSVGTQSEKIRVGTPAFNQLLDKGDDAVKAAYEAGLVENSPRGW